MGQQVKVFRDLEFLGNASHTANINGNPNTAKLVFVDHFTGIAVDTTNEWNSAGQASGAASITAPHHLTITTEANDDDEWAVATGLHYYGQYNAIFEAKLRNDDVSGLQFNIGFSDATSETGKLAMAYATTTLDSQASDYAGFVFDPTATTKDVYAVSVKSNADGTVIDTGHAEGDASWATYRVELRDNGTTTDAIFYFNSTGKPIDPTEDLVGIEADAVLRTTALCVYIGAMNAEAAANTLDVDYVKIWQDEITN